MADFIFQANIAHYKRLLAVETDERKVATLRKLLAEEEARLSERRAQHPTPKAGGVSRHRAGLLQSPVGCFSQLP